MTRSRCSTAPGTALQDVAAAIVVYENALASGRGTEVTLDD